jgi:hypothetical protein
VGIGKSLLVYVPEGAFSPAGEENPNWYLIAGNGVHYRQGNFSSKRTFEFYFLDSSEDGRSKNPWVQSHLEHIHLSLEMNCLWLHRHYLHFSPQPCPFVSSRQIFFCLDLCHRLLIIFLSIALTSHPFLLTPERVKHPPMFSCQKQNTSTGWWNSDLPHSGEKALHNWASASFPRFSPASSFFLTPLYSFSQDLKTLRFSPQWILILWSLFPFHLVQTSMIYVPHTYTIPGLLLLTCVGQQHSIPVLEEANSQWMVSQQTARPECVLFTIVMSGPREVLGMEY